MPLNLSPELSALLQGLAIEIDSSKEEILSMGLVLMGAAVKAKKNGLKLGIADKKGNLIIEIGGF